MAPRNIGIPFFEQSVHVAHRLLSVEEGVAFVAHLSANPFEKGSHDGALPAAAGDDADAAELHKSRCTEIHPRSQTENHRFAVIHAKKMENIPNGAGLAVDRGKNLKISHHQ